jgi:hypothetical protein
MQFVAKVCSDLIEIDRLLADNEDDCVARDADAIAQQSRS